MELTVGSDQYLDKVWMRLNYFEYLIETLICYLRQLFDHLLYLREGQVSSLSKLLIKRSD